MKLIPLIFLPIVFLGNALFAQDFLEITSIEEANKQINNYIYIYEDTSNSIDINQILDKKRENLLMPLNQFKKIRSSKYTYWLYISINNHVANNEPIGLAFPPIKDHMIDVYSLTDSVTYIQKTGFLVNGGRNDEIIPFSNIVQIKNSKREELYVKIRNRYDDAPYFSMQIVKIDKAIKQNSRLMTFDGYVNGVMCIMILYGIFLFFFTKDKLYLYYSIYIILTAIWYFLVTGYGYRLIPGLPRKIYLYCGIPLFLGYIFYIQFNRLFVDTPQILPKWDKALRIFQIVFAIEIIMAAIFRSISSLVIESMRIENILASLIGVCLIFFIIKLFSLKSKLTNIIAIGSSFMIIGMVIGAILHMIINDNSYLSNKVGVLSELILFSIGIRYRYALIEGDKQKFQKQLIIQLNENAELQGKVNRELSEKVKEATAEIVARNKEITDSIRYASLIQTAVLPPIDFITEWGIDNFILYKPKEVVSGDFYWGKRRNGKIIIAAGDCTGHGVPGAFMSMLGHAFLDEIINTVEPDNAGAILDRLRDEVITTLKQKGKRGEAKDGMDMALCIIDKKAGQLMYSGANNPLYLIRENGLIKIEADKMPIGIYSTSLVPFTNQTIEIRKGDYLYLFSDGFADQFGGPYGKKFMYKPFQDLIIQNHTKPMDQQKEILDNTFEEWRGEREQIDDVMVIGLRI